MPFPSAPLPPNPDAYLAQQFEGGFVGAGVGALVREQIYHIVQRCPAQMRRRLVKVTANGPMLTGPVLDPAVTDKERRIWVREAELVGTCADGSSMLFKTGPVDAPNPPDMTNGPAAPYGHWDDWFRKTWLKVPMGLRIDPPPKLQTDPMPPELIAQVRAVNALYPEPYTPQQKAQGPGFVHAPYVVVAGQSTPIDLLAGRRSFHGAPARPALGDENVTITGFRMDPEHSHGTLRQDAQGHYHFMADANYRGPAYFYVGLSEKHKPQLQGPEYTYTNEMGVPLMVVSAQEDKERAAKTAAASAPPHAVAR